MPKIIGNSLEEHRQRTRLMVFAALTDLLETHSFERLTYSQIAKAAGVGRTAMYNHFPDKETLLVEYALHETSHYLERLRAGIAGADSPISAVRLYVRTQLELAVSFHIPSPGSTPLAPETMTRLREHVVMIEGVLRSILEDGVQTGCFRADLPLDSTVRIINTLVVGHAPNRRIPGSDIEDFVLASLLTPAQLQAGAARHTSSPLAVAS